MMLLFTLLIKLVYYLNCLMFDLLFFNILTLILILIYLYHIQILFCINFCKCNVILKCIKKIDFFIKKILADFELLKVLCLVKFFVT